MIHFFACSDASVEILDDTVTGKDPTLEETDTAGDPTGDPTATSAETHAYDGASLKILSPESGDFLPWGEVSSFEAELLDAEGQPLDFPELAWSSDADGAWTPSGLSFDDDSLDVGEHAISATALLPNGDRLVYTVGGVLVQHPAAGIYSGTLSIDAAGEYDGQTYEVGCSGALTMTVDAYGETATGEASCLLSLFGYDLDTTYDFDLANQDGTLEGTAALDVFGYDYAVDSSGSLSDEGELSGSFEADVSIVVVSGTYEATRISRDLSG